MGEDEKSYYIAFLRGINVGGRNRIPMGELRSVLTKGGLQEVRTHIQSGNILFRSPRGPEEILRRVEGLIREAFGRRLGMTIDTKIDAVIRRPSELEELVAGCPFPSHREGDESRILYSFFRSPCPLERSAAEEELKRFVRQGEKLVYSKMGVWLFCPGGYGRSRLNNAFLERKLGVRATTRNLRTITTMIRLGRK